MSEVSPGFLFRADNGVLSQALYGLRAQGVHRLETPMNCSIVRDPMASELEIWRLNMQFHRIDWDSSGRTPQQRFTLTGEVLEDWHHLPEFMCPLAGGFVMRIDFVRLESTMEQASVFSI